MPKQTQPRYYGEETSDPEETRYYTSAASPAACVLIDETEIKLTDKRLADSLMKVSGIDHDERSVTAIISSNSVDRDNEVLLPKGVRLDNYLKNPVVPWSHQTSEPPVGKAVWVKKGHKQITAKVKFAETDRAEEVWQLFKGGFLSAFSVGFMPLKYHTPTPDEVKSNPDWSGVRTIFDEWELLEFSPVAVPANPDALSLACKQKQIQLSESFRKELGIITEELPAEETVFIPIQEFKKVIPVEPHFPVSKYVEQKNKILCIDINPIGEIMKVAKGQMF